ncbi:unnamed protein product [Orchesella dallaii]|uniref:Store-operated calcium entry-associated regulatory factor n=1 Tax=Orchesella dallaii TaxID=48710 RepID=A0ABP1RPU1_9HEXA
MGRISVILLLALCGTSFAWDFGRKVQLRDVKALTLYSGAMAAGRRSAPIPQLRCVGGSADCVFEPTVVQCYNRGGDGFDVQWECKAEMGTGYRFGRISISCEGYDYPDDPYILKGSCGLEYTIELSGYNDDYHPYHRNGSLKALLVAVVLATLIYAIYITCIAPDPTRQRSNTNNDFPRRPGPGAGNPPPPGFRQDFYGDGGAGNDGGFSGGTGGSCNANANAQGSSDGAGGFWTGAAAGALGGYMLGRSGNSGGTHRHGPSTSYAWGSSNNGGSRSSVSSSSSSRMTSGFGGTTRR